MLEEATFTRQDWERFRALLAQKPPPAKTPIARAIAACFPPMPVRQFDGYCLDWDVYVLVHRISIGLQPGLFPGRPT